MAEFGAVINSIQQLPPITAAVATVQITFTAQGPAPLIVQAYSRGAGDLEWNLLETITLDTVGQSTPTTVKVAAGNEFFFRICPRTATDGMLDDTIDGESWETFCSVPYGFVTQAAEVTPPNSAPIPYVTAVTFHPATIHTQNSIHINWSSFYSYTNVLIRYGPPGADPVQEEGAGGTNGFFEITAQPGASYTFALDGDDRWPNAGPSSGFGAFETVVAAPNSSSLRYFLDGTDASGGLRSILKGITSLRAFMQLA